MTVDPLAAALLSSLPVLSSMSPAAGAVLAETSAHAAFRRLLHPA